MFSKKNKSQEKADNNIKVQPAVSADEPKSGLIQSFKARLGGVRKALFSGLVESLVGEKELDEDLLDEIEERLLASDIGVSVTRRVIGTLQKDFALGAIKTQKDAFTTVKSIFQSILEQTKTEINFQEKGVTVIMLIGVNGTGKTTTIGKLAKKYSNAGKKTMVVAGDTFRAAAVEQLKAWSDRAGVEIFMKDAGADPSAVMFEASRKAVAEGFDVMLCDTSGRLHTKKHLMDELEKMKRVMARHVPDAPHYTLLTLDASSGQNAVKQAQEFRTLVGYDGLVLTKMDGSSKGGVVISIVDEMKVPVCFVGLGEQIDDLFEFRPQEFIDGIFG